MIMAESGSTRKLQVVVGLVLGVFIAVYRVLPTEANETQTEAVRLAVSAAFFSTSLALVCGFLSVGLPFVIGALPILLVLRSGGAIYGSAVDLFYLVVAAVACYRLPRSDLGQKVRIGGRWWLLLFAVWCTAQAALEVPRAGTGAFVLPVRITTFFIVVYIMARRMTRETFRITLCALIAGCGAVLAWTLSTSSLSTLFTLRLGNDLGLNPNLIGEFAVLLVFSVILLLVLQEETSIGGFSFLALLLGATLVFLSGSRVAFIQLGFALLLVLVRFRLIRTVTLLISFAMVLTLAIGPDVVAEGVRQSEQYGRLIDLERGQRSDLSRLAWQLAAGNPAFGVGPDNFVEYSVGRGLSEESGEGTYHHDAIAGTAAEFGFVGLGFFLLWYLSFLGSRAVGRRYSVFVVLLSGVAMVEGVTHGLFLDAFGSLPFLLALLAERFVVRAQTGRGPRVAGSLGASAVVISTRPPPLPT